MSVFVHAPESSIALLAAQLMATWWKAAVLAVLSVGAADLAAAREGAPQSCYGPVERVVVTRRWSVYGCSDGKTLLMVSNDKGMHLNATVVYSASHNEVQIRDEFQDRIEHPAREEILSMAGSFPEWRDAATASGRAADQAVRLSEARALWLKSRSANYEFVIKHSCFCIGGIGIAPVRVVVRDGRVSSVLWTESGTAYLLNPGTEQQVRTKVKRGEAVPARDVAQAWVPTIDELHAHLSKLVLQHPDAALRITFDPANGIPTDVFYDETPTVRDDDLVYSIRAFKQQAGKP